MSLRDTSDTPFSVLVCKKIIKIGLWNDRLRLDLTLPNRSSSGKYNTSARDRSDKARPVTEIFSGIYPSVFVLYEDEGVVSDW
jgi:hypothetical protein